MRNSTTPGQYDLRATVPAPRAEQDVRAAHRDYEARLASLRTSTGALAAAVLPLLEGGVS